MKAYHNEICNTSSVAFFCTCMCSMDGDTFIKTIGHQQIYSKYLASFTAILAVNVILGPPMHCLRMQIRRPFTS